MSHPSNRKNPVSSSFTLLTVFSFFLSRFLLPSQSDSHTQLFNLILPLEKASTDLASIRVQDDAMVDARACPVHDRVAFKLVRAGCVLHASLCFHTKEKAARSICSLFLHDSDLKVVEGTRK